MKKILITGGCGFIGSNLATLLKTKYSSYEIIVLDNLKRRGSELNIPRLKELDIRFIHGDIRHFEDLLLGGTNYDCIIDAAAEPSVMSGLDESLNYLVDSNLVGTFNTLKLASKARASFIFLSTSRVYPINQLEKLQFEESDSRFILLKNQSINGASSEGISEKFPLEGYRSFYGATKLGSEYLIHEFNQFMKLKTVINRCGVVAGPWQMGKVDQGVVALWVAKHLWGGDLNYIGYGGTGKQVRDILHVSDLFELIDIQLHEIDRFNGKTFNVGGGLDCSASLKELTQICQEVTDKSIIIGKHTETRQADLPIYITDSTKAKTEIPWRPEKSLRDTVTSIAQWMIDNEKLISKLFKQ